MTEKIQPLKNQKELLNLVFPESAFSYEYLEWLYHSGSDGHHIPSDYSETEELLGTARSCRKRGAPGKRLGNGP